MKTQRISRRQRGFTLIELMVAMTVTTMIVTILVSITAISLDTWTRSRSEVRASRQAKSMADSMGRDLEGLVNRRGTNVEWLSAVAEPAESSGANPGIQSSNAAKLVFYTAPTDRYEGDLKQDSAVGDVSCVGYQLKYQDPIKAQGAKEIPTFVLYRLLVNPDDAYEKILSKSNDSASTLSSMFEAGFQSEMDKTENFVCENVFQYTITMNVTVEPLSEGKTPTPKLVPITLGTNNASATRFSLEAGKIVTDYHVTASGVSDDDIKRGSLTSVEISLTVLTDFGMDQMRSRKFQSPTDQAEFLAKNSYQYSKMVMVANP